MSWHEQTYFFITKSYFITNPTIFLKLFRQYYCDLMLVIFNSKHNETLIQEDQILSDAYVDDPTVDCEKPKNFLVHYQSIRNWNCSTYLYFGKHLDRTISAHLWELYNPPAIGKKKFIMVYPLNINQTWLVHWWGLAKYKFYSNLKDCMS